MAEKLDDLKYIKALDKSDMLGLLIDLPGQIEKAMAIAKDARLEMDIGSISNVVFAGVGGSAIGGDVIKCCLADELNIPFIVNRDYFVTEFINSKTLFFASSYSGNTEETIGAYKDAKKKSAKIIVITSGGILEKMAKEDNYPVVKIPGGMPPR